MIKFTLMLLAFFAVSACSDKQDVTNAIGSDRQSKTTHRVLPDSELVSNFIKNPDRLKQILEKCVNFNSTECASAQRARNEMMVASPSGAPFEYKSFSGGSRDLQKP